MKPSVDQVQELLIPTLDQARYLLPGFENFPPKTVASVVALCGNPELTITVIILLKEYDAELLSIFLSSRGAERVLVPEIRTALKKIFSTPTQK